MSTKCQDNTWNIRYWILINILCIFVSTKSTDIYKGKVGKMSLVIWMWHYIKIFAAVAEYICCWAELGRVFTAAAAEVLQSAARQPSWSLGTSFILRPHFGLDPAPNSRLSFELNACLSNSMTAAPLAIKL